MRSSGFARTSRARESGASPAKHSRNCDRSMVWPPSHSRYGQTTILGIRQRICRLNSKLSRANPLNSSRANCRNSSAVGITRSSIERLSSFCLAYRNCEPSRSRRSKSARIVGLLPPSLINSAKLASFHSFWTILADKSRSSDSRSLLAWQARSSIISRNVLSKASSVSISAKIASGIFFAANGPSTVMPFQHLCSRAPVHIKWSVWP